MFYLVLILVSQGAVISEYRLGTNYGQVFRDFSNNGRHAVNGQSSTTTYGDTFPTDRGAFTFNDVSYIKLPSNDITSASFNLPSTFSIIIWTMCRDDSGRILTRYKTTDTQNYFYLQRLRSSNKLLFRILYLGADSGVLSGSTDSSLNRKFYLEIWYQISILFSGKNIAIYSDSTLEISFTLSSSYSESGTFDMEIGSTTLANPSPRTFF